MLRPMRSVPNSIGLSPAHGGGYRVDLRATRAHSLRGWFDESQMSSGLDEVTTIGGLQRSTLERTLEVDGRREPLAPASSIERSYQVS